MGYRLQAIFLNGGDALAEEIGSSWHEEPLMRRGEGALRRLVAMLGVDLAADEYFVPLTRSYFAS